MEHDFDALIRASKNYKSDKKQKVNENSKERLTKITKKKIETTMIGALSSIEKHFGFLWAHNEQRDLTPEETHMKSIYDEVRSEILDKGNSQIRNIESELSFYDITRLRYQMALPVMSLDSNEEESEDA